MKPTVQHPSVVTALSLWSIIWGLLGIMLSLGFLFLGWLLANVQGEIANRWVVDWVVACIIMLIVAVGYLVFGIGARSLTPRAWVWALGIACQLAVVVLVVPVLLLVKALPDAYCGVICAVPIASFAVIALYILFTRQVRLAFGKT